MSSIESDLTSVHFNVAAQTLVFESRDPGTGSVVAQSPSPRALRALEQDHLVMSDPEFASPMLPSTKPTSISLLV